MYFVVSVYTSVGFSSPSNGNTNSNSKCGNTIKYYKLHLEIPNKLKQLTEKYTTDDL